MIKLVVLAEPDIFCCLTDWTVADMEFHEAMSSTVSMPDE